MTRFLPLALLGIVSFLLVDHVAVPFAWIALLTLVFVVWHFRRASTTLLKIIWLNVGVVVLVLGVIEVQIWLTSVPNAEFAKDFPPSNGYVSHLDFGYGPAAPSRTRVVKLFEGKTIYDVIYTIDENGFRKSPPELDASRRHGCILFVGCSNTFGEGVQDDETMPWQVGVKTGGRFAVRNMGFQGWGPHQILASLESGDAERAVGCDVTEVVYLALYWHALRIAGRSFWDRNGPRYVLDENGKVVRAGYLNDVEARGPLPRRVLDLLGKSFLFKKYFAARLDPNEYPIGPADMALFAGAIDRIHEEAAHRFPHASFHVLFWDIKLAPAWITDFVGRVSKPGIEVHLLSEAIPDYKGAFDSRYTLSPGDHHPTAAAYGHIADYVVANILHDSAD